MKPDGASVTEMEDRQIEPSEMFHQIGLLVVESRMPEPTAKGRGQGPHCPVDLGDLASHRCDPNMSLCVRMHGQLKQMAMLWKNRIPMCVEVLLFPDCAHGLANGSQADTSMAPDKQGGMLLEQWTIRVKTVRSSDGMTSGRALFQAIKSFLYFSQLSAWLNLTHGKSPRNVFYRVCPPGEFCTSSFSENPEWHTFPLASVSKTMALKVTVGSMPRLRGLPNLRCGLPHSPLPAQREDCRPVACPPAALAAAPTGPTTSPRLSPPVGATAKPPSPPVDFESHTPPQKERTPLHDFDFVSEFHIQKPRRLSERAEDESRSSGATMWGSASASGSRSRPGIRDVGPRDGRRERPKRLHLPERAREYAPSRLTKSPQGPLGHTPRAPRPGPGPGPSAGGRQSAGARPKELFPRPPLGLQPLYDLEHHALSAPDLDSLAAGSVPGRGAGGASRPGPGLAPAPAPARGLFHPDLAQDANTHKSSPKGMVPKKPPPPPHPHSQRQVDQQQQQLLTYYANEVTSRPWLLPGKDSGTDSGGSSPDIDRYLNKTLANRLDPLSPEEMESYLTSLCPSSGTSRAKREYHSPPSSATPSPSPSPSPSFVTASASVAKPTKQHPLLQAAADAYGTRRTPSPCQREPPDKPRLVDYHAHAHAVATQPGLPSSSVISNENQRRTAESRAETEVENEAEPTRRTCTFSCEELRNSLPPVTSQKPISARQPGVERNDCRDNVAPSGDDGEEDDSSLDEPVTFTLGEDLSSENGFTNGFSREDNGHASNGLAGRVANGAHARDGWAGASKDQWRDHGHDVGQGHKAQLHKSVSMPTHRVCQVTPKASAKANCLLKSVMRKELAQNVEVAADLENRSAPKAVPKDSERVEFRNMLNNSANMIFHTATGLPLQSSPAPMKKKTGSFGFDSSLNDIRAIKNSISCVNLDDGQNEAEDDGLSKTRMYSTSAPASTNCLLGNFEESMLNGRLEPCGVVEGFRADIGASGAFCPKHVTLPVTSFFFSLSDDNAPSPYLGHINLDTVGKRGYHVPKKGTIQVTLFNPNKTVVKMFVVVYDLSDMPANCQTFLRQRTLYMPVPGSPSDVPGAPVYLRYLIHIRFSSSKTRKIYLHTDIRLIFARDKLEFDSQVANYELRSFTDGPTNPTFSPKR